MLQLFEYELPFRSPFRTGSAIFENRNGILIHYKNNDIDLVVESAPLPGFSEESLIDVKQALVNEKEFIQESLEGEITFQSVRNLDNNPDLNLPSIQFALSYLFLSVLAKKKGRSLHDLFRTIPANTIQVNAVVGHKPLSEMEKKIEEAVQNGFKVIKIKAPDPVEELSSLLTRVQKRYPTIRFRLDANQSWPVSSLKKNCELLQHLRIQYIEEPTSTENLREWKRIQKMCCLPIALDESVSSIKALQSVLNNYPDLFIIIKPTLLGNILKIHETISQFRSSFKHIVCTTTLESSIGRSMVASTACLIGDQNMSHGLHTGPLFADDLLPDLEIKNGSLKCFQTNPATKSFQNTKTSYLKKLG